MAQIRRGKNVSILEIGPYHSPALTGDSVRYFDVLNQNELLQRSRAENLPKTNIPKIHYVSPTAGMGIIKEKFDVIFSAHNIEHQVDLIQHSKTTASLLNKNGKYYLAIPDKRFFFDHFIPETALLEVIATHIKPRKTHDLRTVIAMRCETTHNDPECHFQRGRSYMGGKGYMGDYLTSKDIRKLKSSLTCYTKAVKEYQQANG